MRKGIRDRLEKADQIEIGCSGCGFGHGEGMTAAIEPDDNSSARAPVTYFESALPPNGGGRPFQMEETAYLARSCMTPPTDSVLPKGCVLEQWN